nr:hypothetical protein [Nostoc sp. ChiQUE02]MDZ8233460.1 hypothetical protein [Nostoc sp. ChiQUE02]
MLIALILKQQKQSAQMRFSNREPIKHLLIGSSKAVTSTIHYLQVIGYASVGDWSQLLPTANPGEVRRSHTTAS